MRGKRTRQNSFASHVVNGVMAATLPIPDTFFPFEVNDDFALIEHCLHSSPAQSIVALVSAETRALGLHKMRFWR